MMTEITATGELEMLIVDMVAERINDSSRISEEAISEASSSTPD